LSLFADSRPKMVMGRRMWWMSVRGGGPKLQNPYPFNHNAPHLHSVPCLLCPCEFDYSGDLIYVGIKPHLSFHDWCISLGIRSSRFANVFLNIRMSFLLKVEKYSFLCAYTTFIYPQSVDASTLGSCDDASMDPLTYIRLRSYSQICWVYSQKQDCWSLFFLFKIVYLFRFHWNAVLILG
jgi:hypothetical protein